MPYVNEVTFRKQKLYKQDSRDSSPKPSSYLLDSICPNCSEYLQASQQSISAKDLSQASQLSISAMLKKYSAMLKNAQQCSEMFKNSRIQHHSIFALQHFSMLAYQHVSMLAFQLFNILACQHFSTLAFYHVSMSACQHVSMLAC